MTNVAICVYNLIVCAWRKEETYGCGTDPRLGEKKHGAARRQTWEEQTNEMDEI